MTEPEVSLYIAFYYIKNNLTNEDIHVSIDGAHIKTGNTIHFDIFKFLKYHNCKKVDSDQNRWQGKYCVGDHKIHIVISSVPGIGDINIVMPNGKTILIESKKGKNNKKGQEYPPYVALAYMTGVLPIKNIQKDLHSTCLMNIQCLMIQFMIIILALQKVK